VRVIGVMAKDSKIENFTEKYNIVTINASNALISNKTSLFPDLLAWPILQSTTFYSLVT